MSALRRRDRGSPHDGYGCALDDDLLGSLIGLLRLGNGKGNLAFFLLRTFFRGGSRFLDRRCRLGRRGGSASISVGSVSSVAPPVVAHPAQIRDASTSRVSAAFFIMLIFFVTLGTVKYWIDRSRNARVEH